MIELITSWMESYLVAGSLILLLCASVANLLWIWLHRYLAKKAKNTPNIWDDAVLAAMKFTVALTIWLCFATEFLYLLNENEITISLSWRLLQISWMVAIAWFFISLVSHANKLLNLAERKGNDQRLDKHTRDLIVKILHVMIVVSIILVTLQTFGVKISGLLAVGGAGGLVLGLAAKDLLANFFGGVIIYTDRPFKIGDWIMSPEKQIEGIVEKISWRMTSIRTFSKQPLYVPNSVFASISIQNVTRMSHRRIYEKMGVRYDDVDKLPAILDDIESMLKNHPEIDSAQAIQVRFTSYGASSLDFFVYCFSKQTAWAEFNGVKQDVLLKIAKIVSDHGAEFAFPTTTVHVPEPVNVESAAKAN